MIKLYHLVIFLLLSTFMSTLFAANHPSVPDELMYNGKPIDSLCFYNPDTTNQINLKTCGLKQQKFTIRTINNDLSIKGYIGYDWEDPNLSAGVRGYSYYRFFKVGNNQYWIYSINNSGGSGEFTSISLVKRLDENTLSIQNILGGDRCNGGIQDVKEKNAGLTFSINLTPYDLIALADDKIKELNAYDDLAACAVCCVAKAFYTMDIKLKPQFNYAQLTKLKDVTEMPIQGKYQGCFNKLFFSYLRKDKINLNQEKVNTFTNQFKKVCIA